MMRESLSICVCVWSLMAMCVLPQWDPMITTLPGLYLASVGLIRPLVWLADLKGRVVCSTAMLRFINLLFNSGNLYIIYLIICRLHIKDKVYDLISFSPPYKFSGDSSIRCTQV